MKGSSLSGLFTSGVGRRIFTLFLAAALLPVVFTALLSYNEVHRGLKSQVFMQLREDAKSYGVEALYRLDQLSARSAALAEVIEKEGVERAADHPYLLEGIRAIWRLSPSAAATLVYGSGMPPASDLSDPGSALPRRGVQLVHGTRSDRSSLALTRQTVGGSRFAFVLDETQVWDTSENLPYQTEFCVFTTLGEPVFCTQQPGSEALAELGVPSLISASAVTEWDLDGNTQFAAMWQLFIAGNFGHPGFNIVASQPESYALRSSSDFRRVFLPALALIVILVGALSLNLIGQSLLPLNRLSLAARQFAGGHLSSRVRMKTGDEFEALADSFNYMAGRLQNQIRTLSAMSKIDRLILTGAGFEEVSEDVIRNLLSLTDADAAAVIARDPDSPVWAKMISYGDGEFMHERIAIPQEMGLEWCQPRQVLLEQIERAVAPYKARFIAYGQKYVAIIPVVLEGDLKGILLLGSEKQFDLSQGGLNRGIDLAGRLAVALSSVEREEALYRQAHFDELTGLPNRQLLKDRLEQLLVQTRRDDSRGAMLFLDLDRFKEINDVFGHSIGDQVLIQAAERIVSEVRDSDTVARLGGDEFVVVMPDFDEHTSVSSTATRLLRRLSESFAVNGTNHFVSASIGIVVFPDDGDSVETLLKNADSAMYKAKESGRSRFDFFSQELNAESRRKIDLERELRSACETDDLEVYYQPQFDISTGVISGAEALLRWPHSEHGFVSPTEFIPLAEESGLIIDIGAWVIERTARDLQSILKLGLHPGPVSINVSARQLRDSEFPQTVLEKLYSHDVHPGFLRLEVTETTVAQNRDTAIDILNVLRESSVKVAIDDFGTGYSSLSYLQQMPFDLIKIDKSFIELIGKGEASENICRTIIKMAHELGKEAIAEGVEDRTQFDFLVDNDCDFVQGYFYSEALPLQEFIAFIEKQEFHTQRRKALELI